MARRDYDEPDATPVLQALANDAVGLVMPGGASALAVVQYVSQRRARRKAEEFFTRLAIATGSSNAQAVAEHVAKMLDDDAVVESVERGYRTMMNTLSEEARGCIAVLVSEYIFEKRAPDVAFSRVGALLADATARELRTLALVCALAVPIVEQTQLEETTRVLVTGHGPENRGQFWIMGWRGRNDWVRSEPVSGGPAFLSDVSALSRHGFAIDWTGLSDAAFQGNPITHFSREKDQAFRLLDRCLAPIRASMTVEAHEV